MQPMAKAPIIKNRIVAYLDEYSPQGATYVELAREAYDIDVPGDPTAAQLSAVRRVVAKLVAEGGAERVGRVGIAEGTHRRAGGLYDNPLTMEIRRAKEKR